MKINVLYSGLLVFLFLLIFFALLYRWLDEEEFPDLFDAFYTSGTIQTLVGITNKPRRSLLKFLYTFQSIVAFLLAGGIIVLSFS